MADHAKVSCGFLLKSGPKFLVGHATTKKDDKNIRQFDGNWTIIKGEQDPGETQLEAAIREFREEAGIDLVADFPSLIPPPETQPFNTYKTANSKTIQVYLIKDREKLIENSGKTFSCSSMLVDMPPNFAHREGAPEIDAFRWVTAEEASRMVFKSQRHLFKLNMEDE